MQVRALRVSLGHRAAHGRGQRPALIDGLTDLDPNAAAAGIGFAVESLVQPILPVQRDPRGHGGLIGFDAEIGRRHLMLCGDDRRVSAHGQSLGRGEVAADIRQARRLAKVARGMAHGIAILLDRAQQHAFGARQPAAGIGKLRFGQGHIGAGDFAHVETIPRGAQFLRQQPQVIVAQLDRFRGFDHAHIGRNRAQQDLLF